MTFDPFNRSRLELLQPPGTLKTLKGGISHTNVGRRGTRPALWFQPKHNGAMRRLTRTSVREERLWKREAKLKV